MASRSHEDRVRQAESVGDLVALLRSVVAGVGTREALVEAAQRLWPDGQLASPFPEHGMASLVLGSVWHALRTEADGFFVRVPDLARYTTWLTEGDPRVPRRPLARCRLSSGEIASRLGVPTVRYFLEGLGPLESAQFASLATGRRFVATSAWGWGEPREAGVDTDGPGDDGAALRDLFDTLGIDFDDLIDTVDDAPVAWELWRQDDNGTRARISSFTGLAKARRAVASFEQLGHKQMYWLEERARDAR